jgi:hypothetical protein
MATGTYHLLHDSLVAPGTAPVLGTSFSLADVHQHDLQAKDVEPIKSNRNFRGFVQGIHVRLTNIGAATKVTIRLCADAAGDYSLVPDVEATLAPGITTSTSACAAFKVDLPLFQILAGPGNGNLYLFAKVDAGTPDFVASCITWME